MQHIGIFLYNFYIIPCAFLNSITWFLFVSIFCSKEGWLGGPQKQRKLWRRWRKQGNKLSFSEFWQRWIEERTKFKFF